MAINIPPRADVPISAPILYEDYELIDMNGFSWTNKVGMVVQSNQTSQDPFNFLGNES